MLNYLKAEQKKWKRKKLWVVYVIFTIISFLIQKTAYQDMVRGAELAEIQAELFFLCSYPLLILIQIVVGELFGTAVFQMEYQHNTFRQLRTFPASGIKYIVSKLAYTGIFVFVLGICSNFIFICLCIWYRIPLQVSLFGVLILIAILSAILAAAASIPVCLIAVMSGRNIIVPAVCAMLSISPMLFANMGQLSIEKGSVAEFIIKYVYPPGTGIFLHMEYVFRSLHADRYDMTLPDLNVIGAAAGLVGIAMLLIGVQLLLVRKQEV